MPTWSMTGLMFSSTATGQVSIPIYGTVKPTPKRILIKPSFASCLPAQLIGNFLGDDDQAGLTLTINIAAMVGKQAAGSLLPGPGWLYTALLSDMTP